MTTPTQPEGIYDVSELSREYILRCYREVGAFLLWGRLVDDGLVVEVGDTGRVQMPWEFPNINLEAIFRDQDAHLIGATRFRDVLFPAIGDREFHLYQLRNWIDTVCEDPRVAKLHEDLVAPDEVADD